jgi:predicted short-subunit dehydrogenase-like oxidoreductase (DUF2520 family)
MNIVIVGSGNVATVLGRKFVKAGHHISQVYGRNAREASKLAYEWGTESANYISLINKNADVYIIAVCDTAIADVVKDLHLPGKVIAHTAASVKMNILEKVSDNYGVFYPLQSLRKEQENIPSTPIYVEASNEYTKVILENLAHSLYAEEVQTADYDKRTKLHIAAVIVNNFTNHILSLAEEYCKKEGIDFRELLPLIQNTIERLQVSSPSKMQTGPAFRADQETIQKHIELLREHPQLRRLYTFLSDSINEKWSEK